MINIFIGLSNNQVEHYQQLIPIIEGKENILITSNSLNVKEELFTRVIYSSKSFNNQSSSYYMAIKNIISKISEYKKIIDQIEPYRSSINVRLYFTYIEDILTNYLLFSFNKNLKGIVVEDGTLNYYNHSINDLNLKKVYLKKILCALQGIKFVIYEGHSSGIEYKKVIKQYVRSPELSLFPLKSESLPYEKRDTTLTNTFLIIGQEAYINSYGRDLYIKRLKELMLIIKQNQEYSNTNTIYYKPHRNGERINYELLEKTFEEKKVKILDSDLPLEDLYFNELGSKHIFSFDSSALLNIFIESKKEIQKKIHFVVLLKYNKKLKPIFKKFNFKIIE
ncbi:hypothetical protein [Tenacibaculum sp. 190524A02b]|uniref:hypothetical protein n=1 Tax=Tenacibaculum vairaonense TaxID=3137860 RepID=UPI0031FB3E57